MKRGLVVEKDGQTVIVLTPDGRFQKVKRAWSDAELGSEIVFEDPWLFRQFPYGRIVPVLLLAFLVFIMSGLMEVWEHQVQMYVSVGPEPKVEFGVNRLNRVVEVFPVEMDGSSFGPVTALYGQPIEKVLRELTAVPQEGHAGTSPVYYVVTAPAASSREASIETASLGQSAATHPLQQHLPSALVLSVPADVRDQATKLGVYPGDYAIYWLYTQSGGTIEQLAQFVQ